MVDKEVKIKVAADVDDKQVKELEDLLNNLGDKVVGFSVDVEDGEIDEAKLKEEDLNGSAEFDIDVDDTSVQMAMQNLSDGVSKAKAGVVDLKNALQEVEKAGMQSEQNKAFLEMNLGADKAKQTYQDISDIVASMPGDDNTMRSVLSTAQALGNDLNPQEMQDASKTMADYMSASATMGKMATESQQDIMKYLLDGNVAELERGSIVSSQVDKLKDANTFMERQAAMQEVLNDLGYGGLSTQDTMLNKQAEWEGMLYNSQDALSSMWLGAEKGAMDYIIQLNDASNGIVGMGIVAGSVVGGPLVDMATGLGQMATGMKVIKDMGFITFLKDLEITTKLSAAADWLLSGAQAVLNAVMEANPIVLIVIALIALAAALVWAYQNVDWFREMVDGAWASILTFGQQIYSVISGALAALKPVLVAVGSFIVARVTSTFASIWRVIQGAMNLWNQATATVKSIANSIGNAFNGVKGMVTSAFNGVTHAITAPFMSAYNTIKPIIETIKWALNSMGLIGGGSSGVTTGSAGISMGNVNNVGSANNRIMNTSNFGGSTNITLNGIIEESAGEFIVRKVNEEIYKQNVLRGI